MDSLSLSLVRICYSANWVLDLNTCVYYIYYRKEHLASAPRMMTREREKKQLEQTSRESGSIMIVTIIILVHTRLPHTDTL